VPRVSEDHLTARRAQILAAARTCFLRNGLHNTSMQDLIREADLSVGAVYRYFKSKTEIISAIAEQVAGTIAAQLHEIVERDLPLVESMGLALDTIEDQVGPDGNFPLAVQMWGEAMIDPSISVIVRERYATMRAAFDALAAAALRRGELPPDTDPDGVAAALFAMLPGYALQRVLIGGPDRATYLAGIRALLTGPTRSSSAARTPTPHP
jgi:AcrR family transcriptional regulator